jgi:diguanylate cyclase (GGDEF)-like protein
VALLHPLNLAALGLVRERWLPTPTGQVLLAALAGQVVAVALLVQYAAAWTAAAVRWSPLPASATAWTPLPMLGLVAALASLVVLGTRVLREPDPAGRGLFWAAVVTPVALDAGHLGQLASEGTLYLATAGLALVVAMLEASHSLAYRDELTGLLGRRAFNEALEQVGDRFTVAMVDVDHFKAFNDKHGHAVGDQILKLVGTRLAEIEGGGTPYRYGGEEFAVLFPDTPIEQALPHLERLRTAVEATTFTLRAPERPKNGEAHRRQSGSRRRQDLSVTVSIGAAASGDAGAKPQAVVQAADQALYRAKKDGRNRLIPPP